MTYINKRFGRLIVKDTFRKDSFDWFVCKCDCGKEITTRANHVLSDRTKSCGCYHKELIKKHAHKMGLANRKEMYCKICGKLHYAKGLCKNHYERDRREHKFNEKESYKAW